MCMGAVQPQRSFDILETSFGARITELLSIQPILRSFIIKEAIQIELGNSVSVLKDVLLTHDVLFENCQLSENYLANNLVGDRLFVFVFLC